MRIVCVLILLLAGAAASVAGPAAPTPDTVRAALGRATAYLASIATDGGYVWRYSADLAEREGEIPASSTEIWVQAPGTQFVGKAFLDAYAVTGDAIHLVAAAAAARALLLGQLQSGGWDYTIEFSAAKRPAWAYRVDGALLPGQRNDTTFDDDTTQGTLRFLLDYLHVAEEHKSGDGVAVRQAVIAGLATMLAAQYPNGAWPQEYSGKHGKAPAGDPLAASIPADWPRTWPDRDYTAYYTLNDNTQADCIETMLAAWKQFGDPRYRDAAVKGGAFLILAQLPQAQPGWAQQYDFAMQPAWARAYEPPGIASAESAGAARALIDLYVETGEQRFLAPLPAFMAWLRASALAPGRWARIYELGTNRPLYGDQDGRLHYAMSEISAERQTGYAWEGAFGIPGLTAYYELIQRDGRESYLAGGWRQLDPPRPKAEAVGALIAGQDEQGRWLTDDGWVDMEDFVARMNLLGNYLRAP